MNTTGIVQVPALVLRYQCDRVTEFDADFQEAANKLLDAARRNGRVGVAAPQIGDTRKMFAASIDGPCRLFVNPKVKAREGTQTGREGCLSVAERWFELTRSEWMYVEAQDIEGNPFEVDAHGVGARALQHEMDHLSGILVIDRAREQMADMPRQQRRAVERLLAKVPA